MHAIQRILISNASSWLNDQASLGRNDCWAPHLHCCYLNAAVKGTTPHSLYLSVDTSIPCCSLAGVLAPAWITYNFSYH